MTFPNDDPGVRRDPALDRRLDKPRNNTMMWAGILGAAVLVAILIYSFSGPSNVATNTTPSTTTTQTTPPAATPPGSPSGTTGTSPNTPTPAR